jgi:hypothetical protein
MLYRATQKIPILKTITKIVNSYVFEGDISAMNRFAPPRLWLRHIIWPMSFAAIVTLLLVSPHISFPSFYLKFGARFENVNGIIQAITPSISEIEKPLDAPGSLITTIFPNLLGFGIGVYALIFALAPKSLQFLQTHIAEKITKHERKQGSALILNSSMAYPLIVVTIIISIGTIQQLLPTNRGLIVFSWLSFWYGILVIIELIGVLFGLGEQHTIDKLDPE